MDFQFSHQTSKHLWEYLTSKNAAQVEQEIMLIQHSLFLNYLFPPRFNTQGHHQKCVCTTECSLTLTMSYSLKTGSCTVHTYIYLLLVVLHFCLRIFYFTYLQRVCLLHFKYRVFRKPRAPKQNFIMCIHNENLKKILIFGLKFLF